MNITVTLNGSLEEITIALNAIESHKKRSESLLPITKLPETKAIIPEEVKPKRKAWLWEHWKKAVDLLMGSIESGFAHYKTFDSLTSLSKYLQVSHPAIISPYVKTGNVYKKIYKFQYHT